MMICDKCKNGMRGEVTMGYPKCSNEDTCRMHWSSCVCTCHRPWSRRLSVGIAHQRAISLIWNSCPRSYQSMSHTCQRQLAIMTYLVARPSIKLTRRMNIPKQCLTQTTRSLSMIFIIFRNIGNKSSTRVTRNMRYSKWKLLRNISLRYDTWKWSNWTGSLPYCWDNSTLY